MPRSNSRSRVMWGQTWFYCIEGGIYGLRLNRSTWTRRRDNPSSGILNFDWLSSQPIRRLYYLVIIRWVFVYNCNLSDWLTYDTLDFVAEQGSYYIAVVVCLFMKYDPSSCCHWLHCVFWHLLLLFYLDQMAFVLYKSALVEYSAEFHPKLGFRSKVNTMVELGPGRSEL